MSSWKTFSQKKIIQPEDLEKKCEGLRSIGKSIATLNGSFDLLHAGHLYMIYEAAQNADTLILALNTDNSIKRYKGKNRPIIPLEERLEMLTALEFVDYVTWFEEDDPRDLIRLIKPDVHVNGAEYGHDCIEANVVKQIGGRIHLVKRLPTLATSNIIKRIKACV
ncbi:MAG: Bifunctional protein HldE [Chlamydiales bacterium]|nr:Bifunctional protein HldE [Chlamydiales bacterium]MCH9619921.1 Bifunctional protein HldE [Chlamydiales bacterium]MCH9622652.1 Bifunctional protein HldE [Chlamydiales bacterium]